MPWKVVSCLTSGRISGVDVFVIHLTEELQRRGHDARILLTRAGKEEVDSMPLATTAPIDTLPPHWRRKRRHRRRAVREYLLSLGKCIYIPNYDFDHSIVSARLPSSIQTVGILHSDDPMHYDHLRQLGRFWDRVVAVSQHIAENCRRLNVPRHQIHTIPYGVPTPAVPPARHRQTNDPIRLVYVGRLEQTQKRVLDFPKLMDELDARGIPFVLTMAGDGPTRRPLELASQKYLADGRLKLLGIVPNAEIVDLYRHADVFVLTSAFEGLPVSLLEAMAQGCVPVVARVASGVGEVIVEGENGWTATVGETSEFADHIAHIARHPHEQERLSRAAHASIAQGPFGLKHMVDSYEKLFEQIESDAATGRFVRPRPYFAEVWLKEWQCRLERNWRRVTGRKHYLPPA